MTPPIIVIIEDEAIVAFDLKSHLEFLGYHVPEIGASGEEALALAEKLRPNLILMDIGLQGKMDGIAAAQQIRERWHIPIIFLTANSDPATTQRVKLAEPLGFIFKPFNERELSIIIESALYKQQMDRAVQESEERYRHLVESSHDWIWEVDQNEVYTFSSPHSREFLGYEPSEVIGKTPFDLMPPEEAHRARQVFLPFKAEKKPFRDLENTNLHKNGNLVILETNAIPIIDAQGNLQGYRGTDRNITARKQIERAQAFLLQCDLTASKEDFFKSLARYLAESLSMDYICIDRLEKDCLAARTLAVYSNGRFEDNLSYTLNDTPCGSVVGKTICYFPNGVRHLFPKDAALQELMAESYVGTTLWSSQGHPIGLIAVIGRKPLENAQLAESILKLVAVRAAGELERRQTEESVHQSEELLRSITDHSEDTIYVKDRDSRILFVNPAGVKSHGLPMEQILGRTDAECHPNYPETAVYMAGDRRVMQSRQAETVEEDYTSPTGEKGVLLTTKTPRLNFEGEVIGIIGITRDITECKRVEDDLRRTVERFDLAARAAHLGVWDRDIQKNRMIWDDRMLEIYGIKKEDFSGAYEDWIKRIHPDDVARCEEAARQALSGEKEFDTEFRIIWPNGALRHIKACGQVVRDANGNALRIIGVNYDITEHTETESELKETAFWLKESQRVSSLGSYVFDVTSGAWANSENLDFIFGIPPSYPKTTEGWLSIIHPDDRMRMERYLKVILASRKHFFTEYRIIRPQDGQERWIAGHGEVTQDAKTGGLKMFGTIQDITVRKEAENAQRQSTSLLQATLGSTADGILVSDQSGKVSSFNARFAEMWHLPKELQTTSDERALLEFIINQIKDPEAFHARTHELYQQPEACCSDYVEFKDGRTFERYSQPQYIDRRVVGRVWSFRDITEHKRAVESLRTSEEKFAKSFRYAPLLMYISKVDDGTIVDANQKFVEASGFSHEEALGKSTVELGWITEEDRQLLVSELKKQGRLTDYKLTLTAKSGKKLHTLYNGEIIVIDGQQHFLSIVQDVTEKKQLEDQFRQAQKMEAIGQLAGGVAHDFNNLLTATTLHLSALETEESLTPEVRASLRELMDETKRAANLTRQLLTFSRRQVMQIKPVDLKIVLAQMFKMLKRLIGEDIVLVFPSGEQSFWVNADTGMMEQIVMNLCVNARDAMPKGGHLKVELNRVEIDGATPQISAEARPGRFVSLSVTDTGCGMDAETLRRIFDPFFTTKSADKGTGLGLATVHGIVTQHQGWIEVESGVGKGTTFRLYIPATDAPAVSTAAHVKAGALRGTETVLLVEDESGIRKIATLCLRRMGFVVLEAANAIDATQLWNQHKNQVAMVFTDMVMPGGMNGLELAESLREQKPGLKILITSGYNSTITDLGATAVRNIAFLPKPYTRETLAKAVRGCFDRKQGF